MQRLKQHRVITSISLIVVALFITATLILTRPEPDPFMGDAIVDPPFTSLSYGMQAFLWWDGGEAGLYLDWIHRMNFSYVKQVFAWRDMEPEQGQWIFTNADRIVSEVEQRGMHIVVRLSDVPDWAHPQAMTATDESFIDAPPDDLSNWGNFCSTIATRYQGRIAAYQIWNEPNLMREWGNQPPNAEAYVALLRICSEAIRAADPDAILISAGLSPTGRHDDVAHRDDMYLQAMYNAGFQQYIDVVGIHAPGFAAPEYGPDDAERDGQGRWATFRRVEDMRKIMILNGDAARQIAILETGWTTDIGGVNPDYAWFAVDEETQADYFVRAYQYAAENWRPWVGLMSGIYIARPTWNEQDEEYWWAITTPDNLVRPAYIALANMVKFCGDRVIPERDPSSAEAVGLVPPSPCN